MKNGCNHIGVLGSIWRNSPVKYSYGVPGLVAAIPFAPLCACCEASSSSLSLGHQVDYVHTSIMVSDSNERNEKRGDNVLTSLLLGGSARSDMTVL